MDISNEKQALDLVKKIRDEKMSLDDDSYYDDLVTLSVGKMVVGKLDNDVILEKIREYLGEAYEDDYFLKKVQRARSKCQNQFALSLECHRPTSKNMWRSCQNLTSRVF